MMISRLGQREAFVWLYLPGGCEPVVCGRVAMSRAGPDGLAEFVYGRSYRQRNDAMALLPHDLEIAPRVQRSRRGLHGVLRDAAPDAWGRRVLLHRLGMAEARADQALTELDYLLSGADRPGALRFQTSADPFESPRPPAQISLAALSEGVLAVERNQPLEYELLAALAHGASIGGARPKALVDHDSRPCIAKFASSTDAQPMIALEATALALAERCGLETAASQVVQVEGKDVLLIERFDVSATSKGLARRHFFSALTALDLDEMEARYAGYPLLADYLRRYGDDPGAQCRALFDRMVFNILIGNADDHARNHALFWDGRSVRLTPAYDLCIWPRMGGEASQAMDVGHQGKRATIANALSECQRFGLTRNEAMRRCRQLADCIRGHWLESCQQGGLRASLGSQLMGAVVLGCLVLEGLD